MSTDSDLAKTFNDDVVERHARHFVDLLLRTLDVPSTAVRALDLACGTGYGTVSVLQRLPKGSMIVALSDDRFRLKELHKQLGPEERKVLFPRKETLQRLPFAESAFDLAWACWPTHVPALSLPVLRGIIRLLRPGGQLVLVLPLHGSLLELIHAIGSSEISDAAITVQRLIAETPQLDDLDSWRKRLTRAGGCDVSTETTTFALHVQPPASSDRLVARHLLPLWVGEAAKDIDRILDRAISAPLEVSILAGCITVRRGAEDLDETPRT